MVSAQSDKAASPSRRSKDKVQGEVRARKSTQRKLRMRIDELKLLWENSRRAGVQTERYDQPNNVLRRNVYQLAKWIWVRANRPGALEHLNGLRRERNPRAKPMSDVFRAIISLVVTDEEFSREEQNRLANELEYARRHRIPPELLVGFILQVGAGKNIKNLVKDQEKREPWFKEGEELVWQKEE